MTEFLNIALTFPTILYTGLLALVTVYWILTILGFFDIEILGADVDLDTESSPSLLSGFLNKFKLDGVPVTLSLSLVVLFSWVVCFLVTYWFIKAVETEWIRVVLGFWAIVLAPFVTAPLVAILITPLKPLFKSKKEQSANDFVGRVAKVRSSKVTNTFGEAELSDKGAGLIIKIRAEEPNGLKRGDQVRIRKYDADDHTYSVRADA